MNEAIATETRNEGGPIGQHTIRMYDGAIAKLMLGYWLDKKEQEALISVTNPIGQHIAFYVRPTEKARVIKELRAALDAWEKAP